VNVSQAQRDLLTAQRKYKEAQQRFNNSTPSSTVPRTEVLWAAKDVERAESRIKNEQHLYDLATQAYNRDAKSYQKYLASKSK
jgi:hypothetical protein